MFLWFTSPWEAARRSLEAQRVMAFQFLDFASGQDRQRQEFLSNRGKAVVSSPADQSVVASSEPAISAGSPGTGRRKTAPVRKAVGALRTPVGIKGRSLRKVKGKGPRRKHKTRRR